MSSLARRGAIAGPRVVVRTYAEFQSQINTLSGGMTRLFNVGSYSGAGTYRLTSVSPPSSSVMSGTSWNNLFRDDETSPSRTIQHGFPSESIFNTMTAGGFECLATVVGGTPTFVAGITRNGYTSNNGVGCDLLLTRYIRWDDVLKKAFEANPSIGGSESEYVW